jgi:hypothetical protein
MLNPIREAKETISGWIDEIKSFFENLKLKIPSPELPKLPKFSLQTGSRSIMGKEVTYPTGFNVNWNARGAYFDRPVVFNSDYGLQGFGEAGGEIAMPAEGRHMYPFADAVAERLTRTLGSLLNGEQNIQIEVHNTFDGDQIRTTVNRRNAKESRLRDGFHGK